MDHDAPARPYSLIVGVHDLAETPDAQGEELGSWLPFSRAKPVLDAVHANSMATRVPLHITSDDAFRSDFELLLPWLLAHEVGATFFVPTDFVGRPGRLSVGQLRELHQHGMRIGVHGARHIRWSGGDQAAFIADVRKGRETLRQWMGHEIDLVAPPYGVFDREVVRWLVGEGFREIHSTRGGIAVAGEALKPRNMLKDGSVAAVLQVSRQRGGVADRARARLRQLKLQLSSPRSAA